MTTQLEQAARQALKFVVGIHPAFICEAMNHTKAQRHSTLDSCPHIETQRQVAEALRTALEQIPPSVDSNTHQPAQDEPPSDTSQKPVDETAKQRHEQPCPYVVSTREGTHHCSLSHREPLSDEQMKNIWYETENIMGWYSFQEIARAIEQAHGIGEKK